MKIDETDVNQSKNIHEFYLVILGRNVELSIYELYIYLKQNSIDFKFLGHYNNVLLLLIYSDPNLKSPINSTEVSNKKYNINKNNKNKNNKNKFNPHKLVGRLAGIIKIVKVYVILNLDSNEKRFNSLEKLLNEADFFLEYGRNIRYSFEFYTNQSSGTNNFLPSSVSSSKNTKMNLSNINPQLSKTNKGAKKGSKNRRGRGAYKGQGQNAATNREESDERVVGFIKAYLKNKFKSLRQKAVLKSIPIHALVNSIKDPNFIDFIIFRLNIKVKNTEKNKYFHYEYLEGLLEALNEPCIYPLINVRGLDKHIDLLFLGRTIAVHDNRQHKRRYEQRPYIDETIGTSIRIAQILINLVTHQPVANRNHLESNNSNDMTDMGYRVETNQSRTMTILDPFAGIGTILQEALIMGYNCIGVEINHERAQMCKRNLEWAKSKFKFKNSFRVYEGDSRYLTKYIHENSVDYIVSEPELGPLLKDKIDVKTAKNIITDLERIYVPFFKEAEKVLSNKDKANQKGQMLLVLPKIIVSTSNARKNISFSPSISKLIKDTKFRLIKIPDELKQNFKIKNPLYYKEEWHKIGRLIYLFEIS
ncbi:MAG: TRM11 family SAM-dependent methyltransferase [Promethearchaeota archaeon]